MREFSPYDLLIQNVIDAVETGTPIPRQNAEGFSNFVYDGGRAYAVQAVRALCEESGFLRGASEEVVVAVLDWYVTELVRPVAEREATVEEQRDSYEAFMKRRKTLIPFLTRVRDGWKNREELERRV